MSGSSFPSDPNVRTVYLGAFTHEHADAIAGLLEEAAISWWYKQPGFLSRLWEGDQTRLYVDKTKGEQAVACVRQIMRNSG